MAKVFRRNWTDRATGARRVSPYFFLEYRDPVTREWVRRRTDPPATSQRAAESQLAAAVAGLSPRPGPTPPPGTGVTLGDVLDAYERHLRRSSASTWANCGSRVREWREAFSSTPAAEFGKAEVRAFVEGLEARGLSDSTVYGFLTLLRAAIRRAVEEGLLEAHSLQTFKIRHRPAKRLTVWRDEDLEVLRRRLEPEWTRDVLDVLRTTGLRVSDALALRWSEVDSGLFRIVQGKTRDPHEAPISAEARRVLARIERTSSPFVFPSRSGHRTKALFSRHFCAARKAAGLEGFTIHDVRRTFAHRAFNEGYSAGVVAGLLGHASTTLVPNYAHADLATLRAAADVAARKAPKKKAGRRSPAPRKKKGAR